MCPKIHVSNSHWIIFYRTGGLRGGSHNALAFHTICIFAMLSSHVDFFSLCVSKRIVPVPVEEEFSFASTVLQIWLISDKV